MCKFWRSMCKDRGICGIFVEFLAELSEHLSLFYIENSTKFLWKTVLAEPAEPSALVSCVQAWNLKFEMKWNVKSQSCEIVCALWNKWNNWNDIQNRNQIRHLTHQLQIQKKMWKKFFKQKKILKKNFCRKKFQLGKIFLKNFKKIFWNFFFLNFFSTKIFLKKKFQKKKFFQNFFFLKIEFVKLNFQMQQNICKNQIGTKKASFPRSPV